MVSERYRDGMLHAARICKNEFQNAPNAARDHDSVWMGGYESACDHLSIAIEQAAVIDCVRTFPTATPLIGEQKQEQIQMKVKQEEGTVAASAVIPKYNPVSAEYTDLQCASFDTADAVYEYLLRELAEEEETPNITAHVEKATVRITYHDLDRFSGERKGWDMQLLGFRDGLEFAKGN